MGGSSSSAATTTATIAPTIAPGGGGLSLSPVAGGNVDGNFSVQVLDAGAIDLGKSSVLSIRDLASNAISANTVTSTEAVRSADSMLARSLAAGVDLFDSSMDAGQELFGRTARLQSDMLNQQQEFNDSTMAAALAMALGSNRSADARFSESLAFAADARRSDASIDFDSLSKTIAVSAVAVALALAWGNK